MAESELSLQQTAARRKRWEDLLAVLKDDLASIKFEAAKGTFTDQEMVRELEEYITHLEQKLNIQEIMPTNHEQR